MLLLISCTAEDPNDENVIYSKKYEAVLVLGEGVTEKDVVSVKIAYQKSTGRDIAVALADSEPSAREIIIGKTDRQLSLEAYELLGGAEIADGYYICSDEKSVAIAFDEALFGVDVCFNEAIRHFVSEHMQEERLKLSDGVVCFESFDMIERQRERDEEETLKLWELKEEQLAEKLGGEDADTAKSIISSLKDIRAVFAKDDELTAWLAGLYDPVSGGFYYSNSAKAAEGYLPDLESTAQALSLAEAMLSDRDETLTDLFGEERSKKLVSFVKKMQDPVSGYFYHPQWPAAEADKNQEGRQRDLISALYILDRFGASPTYDAPNGAKGDGIAAETAFADGIESSGESVAIPLAARNEGTYVPVQLASEAAFKEYLSTFGIKSDTAAACERIYSEIPLYLDVIDALKKEGKSYPLANVLHNFLYENQNKETGFWSTSSEISRADMETFLTVVKIYNAIETAIPRYDAVLSTMVSLLRFDGEIEDISAVSDTWMTLAAAVGNLTSYTYGKEIYLNSLKTSLASLYRSLDKALPRTAEILKSFAKGDGALLSTTPQYSASHAYGMPKAPAQTAEGDINAAFLAVNNIWISIFVVLDSGYVPIFTVSDRMIFKSTMEMR